MPVVKNPPGRAGDLRDGDSISGLGRSSGEGCGNPLQYSCLENSMDRRAWWATVHRVSKSQTRWSYLACTHAIFPEMFFKRASLLFPPNHSWDCVCKVSRRQPWAWKPHPKDAEDTERQKESKSLVTPQLPGQSPTAYDRILLTWKQKHYVLKPQWSFPFC